jgi:hypothetical protein
MPHKNIKIKHSIYLYLKASQSSDSVAGFADRYKGLLLPFKSVMIKGGSK